MRKNSLNKNLAFAVIALIALADGILLADHFYAKDTESTATEAVTIENSLKDKAGEEVVEEKIEKSVPFTTQAPMGIWKSPWTDYSEEACLYMAYKWANNEGISTKEEAADGLFGIGTWEKENFGSSRITDASQTLQILKEYLSYTKASLSYDVSVEEIKTLLDQDMVIIVPVNGATLSNPHYGNPAPAHHMILIYDYTDTTFIANDPGTVYGSAYAYDQEKLLSAIQDISGDKVMIAVSR